MTTIDLTSLKANGSPPRYDPIYPLGDRPFIPSFSHGSSFTFTNANLGTNIIQQKGFSGGSGGIVESLTAGAIIPESGNWHFTLAAHSPTVYNDPIRGKVMYNDFNASVGNITGTVASASGLVVNVTGVNWLTGAVSNVSVLITGGTGAGQTGWILSNTSNSFTVQSAWTTPLDSTSTFIILKQDLDATKGFQYTNPIPPNMDLYYTRMVKANIKTYGGVNYPSNTQLQWKMERFIDTNSISDTGVNAEQEMVLFNWQYPVQKIFALENDSGLNSGTSSGSNTLTAFNDTSKNWTVNQWEGMTLIITGGTGNGGTGKIVSNTANQLTLTNMYNTTDSTSTYNIVGPADYGSNTDKYAAVNDGNWYRQEWIIHTSDVGVPNGSCTLRVWKNGVPFTVFTKANYAIYGGAARFQFMQAQDYFGNNTSVILSKEVWTDDIFTQAGSTLRVVITDNTNIDLATVYELQDWSSWSSGTITGTINKGGITGAGNYYLCAVSGINNVIWSQPIILS